MFQGKTIDELVEIVLLAEHRAKQSAGKSYAGEVEDGSSNELHLMAAATRAYV